MDTQTLKHIRVYCLKKYSSSNTPRHDAGHMERVRKNALAITKILGLQKRIDTNLLQSACYLHDIVTVTCYVGSGTILSNVKAHVFEKLFIKKHIVSIVSQFHLRSNEKNILVTAITNHPYSIPYRRLHTHADLYSKILQDADSLDYVSKERLHQFCRRHPSLSFLAHRYIFFIRSKLRFFLNFSESADVVSY